MASDLVDGTLAALSRCADADERTGLLRRTQRVFLDRPGDAAVLARRIAGASPDASLEDPLSLLAAVLDEARMADENGLSEGTALIRTVARQLEDLVAAGALGASARFTLAQAYVRAGLEPPPATTLDHELAADMKVSCDGGPVPDLGSVIDSVHAEAGGEPLQFHAALAEMLASLPPPARAVAIAQISGFPRANFARLGAYWLLDRAPEVRQAVAEVCLGRARTSGLTRAERMRLVIVRKWLPADAARDLLDQALRETLGKHAEACDERRARWKFHKIAACLPDGAGAQSLLIAAQQGSRRAVAMLLLKAGHGVKDAFVLPCESAAEQKRLLAQVVEQTGPFEVDLGHVRDAIGWALGDGIAAGLLPAPGLVDVAEILGDDLVPGAPAAASLIASIDVDGVLGDLSPQKRTRLVEQSGTWPEQYALVDTWFEDNGPVRELLDRGGTRQTRRAALWRYLETRREWWATTFARSAATLQAARTGGDAWLAFAVTSLAVLEGRPLKKMPIMAAIAAKSLEASDHRRLGPSAMWDEDEDEGGDEPVWTEFIATEPEEPGELDRYLAGSGMTSAWFDGWFVAVAVAPKFLTPTTWLGPLLKPLAFADHSELQRFLDLLMLRMNAVNDHASDAQAMTERLHRMGARERSEWAAGFAAFVEAYPSAWPRRARAPDDERIIAGLREAAECGMNDGRLKLLGTWISLHHARRA